MLACDVPQGEKASMFFAALTSRLCVTPQRIQPHSLTPSVLSPLGPVRAPQSEQVTLDQCSRPGTQTPASLLALYDNWNLTPYQAASRVDLANGVLISLALETSPITMYLARRAMAVVALCVQSCGMVFSSATITHKAWQMPPEPYSHA